MNCVNPLHVGELISTASAALKLEERALCQSPSRRGTHFYNGFEFMIGDEVIVSIPFTSGNSFLHKKERRRRCRPGLCQSPSRRGTHFYNILRRAHT